MELVAEAHICCEVGLSVQREWRVGAIVTVQI